MSPSPIADLLASQCPFAVIRRGDSDELELLTGSVIDVPTTADIPLDGQSGAQAILALVPFRQIVERGFDAVDDGAPLRCLVADRIVRVPLAQALTELPATPPAVTPSGFDIDDEAYAAAVRDVIAQEIGTGEGANFVLHRSFRGLVALDQPVPPGVGGLEFRSESPDVVGSEFRPDPPGLVGPESRPDPPGVVGLESTAGRARAIRRTVLAWMRALLGGESGSYWTFAIVTPGIALAGASPERHVSMVDGVVTMNPISGTYRHPAGGPSIEGMLAFLTDAKENDELFMVVDEELKLMSTICPTGGHVVGPFLKPMSRVTHTEYLLVGRTELDPRQVLRETMFAPTVTGSPMRNACSVIARREARPRGYYAGVLALFERPQAADAAVSDGVASDDGRGWDLDAPILIRTAYLADDGTVSVPAGATLVRHSDPASEVAETRTKAAGVLAAVLGSRPQAPDQASASPAIRPAADDVARPTTPAARPGLDQAAASDTDQDRAAASAGPADEPGPAVAQDRRVQTTLMYRNERLAPFWLKGQRRRLGPLEGLRIGVVDAEDAFAHMLAHQLRFLGARVDVRPWQDVAPGQAGGFGPADLVVAGPGPGDPSGQADRIVHLRQIITGRLASRAPLLAVCLSHQILAHQLGLGLRQLARPHQGEQIADTVFGFDATIGYYNTFTAVAPLSGELPADVEVARRRGTDEVIALRGSGFASAQGHLESALSTNGIDLLTRLVLHAIGR